MQSSGNGCLTQNLWAGPENPSPGFLHPRAERPASRAPLFQYTHPWQVFCAVLGSKMQNLQNSVIDANVSQQKWMNQEIPVTKEHLPQTQDNTHEISLPKMESSARNLFNFPQNMEFKNEERNGQQVILQQELRFEDKGNKYIDTGHHDQKDPTEDKSQWKAKSISGRMDAWSPHPDRESKLEVVKSGSCYNIRAYKGEKKPSRLYEEDEELRYKISSKDLSPDIVKQLEEERQEVIRSQVVRKSNTMAEKRSSMNDLEAINKPSTSKVTAEPRKSYSTGFAVCFDNPSPDWMSIPVDPENIVTEQIDFAAARQQFLVLEKTNPKALLGCKKQTPFLREATSHIYGREEHQDPRILGKDKDFDGYNQRRSKEPSKVEEFLILPKREANSYSGTNFSSGEKMASGLEETPDLRMGFVNGRISKKESGNSLASMAGGQDPTEETVARKETPIEQEIRLAKEREEDLWKERGIQRASSKDDLVEIRLKPLLSSPISSPASSRKGKDKPRVSFYVQREIEQEAKREEDLQKEGRLLGTYDRGLRQELAERRKVFEQEGEEAPQPSLCKPKKQGELLEPLNGDAASIDCNIAPCREDTERITGQKVNWSKGNLGNELSLNQGTATSHPEMGESRSCVWDLEAPRETSVLKKRHFAIPVQKLQFSFTDSREPSNPLRREHKPQKAAPQDERYTIKTWRPRTSVLIDQEIKDSLQRELELQEQRRKIGSTLGKLPISRTSSQSSAASGDAGQYSVSSSPLFIPNSPMRLPVSPVLYRTSASTNSSESDFRMCQSPTPSRMRQREEGKYAGIELNDEIDSEVVKSTKPICRRGVLAQLWETGQIRNIDDSDSD